MGIINILFSCVTVISGGTFILYKLNYNVNYINLMINLFHNFMYYKSIFEIKINRLSLEAKKWLEFYNINIFNQRLINDIEFVKDGKIVLVSSKEKLIDTDISKVDLALINYDFFIYSEIDKITGIINKKLIYDNKVDLRELDFKIEKSNYLFLLFEVILPNDLLKIDLMNENNNYIIVDNKISVSFLNYFLQRYHPDVEYKDLKLKILDQNVKEISINNKNELIIKKNEYKINNINKTI